MHIGAILPQNRLPTDPGALRDFAVGVGADPSQHPDGPALRPTGAQPGGWAYTHADSFHEPMVVFGYLAALTRLELVTGVLILPQRQTVLVAKQAAEVDVLSGGRTRLGVGIGWNGVEYQSLGEDFATRGRRIEEQVALLRRLWTEPVVTFDGEDHRVVGAGLNPLPVQRPIPIWMGTRAHGPALRRTGRVADGWLTMDRPGPVLDQAWATVRREAEAAGRDPANVGLEGRISCLDGDTARMANEAEQWRAMGATHLSLTTIGAQVQPAQAHLDLLADATAAVRAAAED
jgi:probable F420-dependent oxidoreductase